MSLENWQPPNRKKEEVRLTPYVLICANCRTPVDLDDYVERITKVSGAEIVLAFCDDICYDEWKMEKHAEPSKDS